MTRTVTERLRLAVAPVPGGLMMSGCVWQSDDDALDAKHKAASSRSRLRTPRSTS
jgi:hypothetical protein